MPRQYPEWQILQLARERLPPIRCFALLVFSIFVLLSARLGFAAQAEDTPRQLLIRCDDAGMCHAVNTAIRQIIATGLPFSTSVMVACPWFLEAAEILRESPDVSVGVHLTLNSEWGHYKWGPVLGSARVPTLVDPNGYFMASRADFEAATIELEEARAELRAQIERALRAGLRIDYVDDHMLTALSTVELREIVEQLAKEFGLGIAEYFGEHPVTLWDVAPEKKLSTLLRFTREARPGLNLFVIHLGKDSPEMAALIDTNYAQDPFRVSRHRQAELDAITSPAFLKATEREGIQLVTYREIIQKLGLASMTRHDRSSVYSVNPAEVE
jgi:predicted glycoside hydrolase/deacetylase ChbG (UPF0249 family)